MAPNLSTKPTPRPRPIRVGGDLSPDSVIFAPHESNLISSIISSSADRGSFASDHENLSSEINQPFAGFHADERSRGPDLRVHPPPPPALLHGNHASLSLVTRKADQAKVPREKDNTLLQVNYELPCLDSARNSCSLAHKGPTSSYTESHERISRSGAPAKKKSEIRFASLDLRSSACSDGAKLSPWLGGAMKKGPASVSSKKSGNFSSPVTPRYHHGSGVVNKGWSSERVPLPANGNRMQVGDAALLPFNAGRTLPSKWEDAERWILSPVVVADGITRSSYQQPQRRPKSKSGPLGLPGVAYYAQYSPAVPMYCHGSHVSNSVSPSPFSAGVMGADGLSLRCGGDDGGPHSKAEACITRSASVHGCTDLICESSVANSQDEKADNHKDASIDMSPAVSRRDMATQMSPSRSSHSSPKRRSFSSPATPSVVQIVETWNSRSSKVEVRDVLVDEQVTVTRLSKKQKSRVSGSGSDDVDSWKVKAVKSGSSSCGVSESAAKNISKAKREEAKISAWENLQKAKAEAAIRRLEMKLEKKRSSSMDKIMGKLRSAQKKAQEMRNAVLVNQEPQVSKVTRKAAIFSFRTRQVGSLSGCFACRAF